jgi:hypothetical protein
VVRETGRVMVVRLQQSRKASPSRVVREAGKVMVVRLVQP